METIQVFMTKSCFILTIFFLKIQCLAKAADPSSQEFKQNHFIAIAQIVEHPSLNEVRSGILSKLKKSKLTNGIEYKFFNAQGDMTLATQIAQKIVGEEPKAIISITTPMSQSIAARKPRCPQVFSVVNNPIEAKLLPSLKTHHESITGVIHLNPIEKQLQLIKDFIPKIKNLGVIYNPGEANSHSDIQKLGELAKIQKINIIETTVSSSAQVFSSSKILASRVEAIYFPTDNTVVSAVEGLLKAAASQQIPVFSADADSVEKGALATISPNHFHMGELTAELAIKSISNNNNALPLPVFPKIFDFVINQKTAHTLKMVIPASVAEKATKIIPL